MTKLKLFREEQPEARGSPWGKETIETALQLKFACGENGYNLLLKNKLPLPTLRTLRHRLVDLKFDTGISDDMFEFLKLKTPNWKPIHKICALSFDEMSLVEDWKYDVSTNKFFGNTTFPDEHFDKEKATHALVFMLGGVAGRWKQVVAYEFTCNSTNPNVYKEIILKIINKAKDIGLHVISCTSDMSGSNQAIWKIFGVGKVKNKKEIINSIPHPCFPEKKLYFFSDAPHAFKNTTQSLLHL